jgi:hypothetical protein
MVPFKKISLAAIVGAAWLVGASALVACSDNNSNQTPPVYGNPDATTADGQANEAGATEEAEAATTAPTVDSGAPDASDATIGPTADAAQDAASDSALVQDAPASDAADAAACVGTLSDAGCWVCPSASTGSLEFLNQCGVTGVKCVPFNNATRLPADYDGGLN